MHKVENLHLVLQSARTQKKKKIKIKVKHQNIFSPSSIKCNESFTSLQKRNYMVKDEICDM